MGLYRIPAGIRFDQSWLSTRKQLAYQRLCNGLNWEIVVSGTGCS